MKTEEQRQQAEALIKSFFAEKKIRFTPVGSGRVEWADDRNEWIIWAEVVARESDLEEVRNRLRAAGLL